MMSQRRRKKNALKCEHMKCNQIGWSAISNKDRKTFTLNTRGGDQRRRATVRGRQLSKEEEEEEVEPQTNVFVT